MSRKKILYFKLKTGVTEAKILLNITLNIINGYRSCASKALPIITEHLKCESHLVSSRKADGTYLIHTHTTYIYTGVVIIKELQLKDKNHSYKR